MIDIDYDKFIKGLAFWAVIAFIAGFVVYSFLWV